MRIVLVHGFTQGPWMWQPVVQRLPRAINGESLEAATPEVPEGLAFAETAEAICQEAGRAIYCGYSMGARLVLCAALRHPENIDALVLVSGTAGIGGEEERARRREADEALARRVERDGVERFVERWVTQPMFASIPPGASQAARRARENTVERLTSHLRQLGQGSQDPMWDRLHEISVPVALVTGEKDGRYAAIAERMKQLLPDATRIQLPGGHAVPLEHPARLAESLLHLLHELAGHGRFGVRDLSGPQGRSAPDCPGEAASRSE